jgi:hypothetical protein
MAYSRFYDLYDGQLLLRATTRNGIRCGRSHSVLCHGNRVHNWLLTDPILQTRCELDYHPQQSSYHRFMSTIVFPD